MLNKNHYLNLAILNMVHSCIVDGKIQLLVEMGFTTEQLNRIRDLSYSQIKHIADSQALFINVSINTQMFDTILERAKEHEALNATIDKAISLGASIDILNSYFGLSTTDISCTRKLKALSVSKGRVRKPNEDERAIIWQKWAALKHDNPNIDQTNNQERLLAYMDITQHIAMRCHDQEPLTLTSVINELEQFIYETQGE